MLRKKATAAYLPVSWLIQAVLRTSCSDIRVEKYFKNGCSEKKKKETSDSKYVRLHEPTIK